MPLRTTVAAMAASAAVMTGATGNGLTLSAPAAAAPSASPAVATKHQWPGSCSHAWTRIWPDLVLDVYSEPRLGAYVVDTVRGPKNYPCRFMQVGGSYHQCGAVNTGWVLIPLEPYPNQGWIPNQCTEDPVLDFTQPVRPMIWETDARTVDYVRPGACRHAWMRVFVGNLAVRSEPRANAPEIARVADPRILPCRAMVVGGLYGDFCGRPNTGWVLIPLDHYPAQGWIPSQCTQDPDIRPI